MKRPSSSIPQLLGRSLRYSSPEIILLEGVPIEPRSLTPPGTVTCLVAKQGSPLLGQIRSAAHQKDYDQLRRHGDTIAMEFAKMSRRRGSLFGTLRDIPVLTEFRYGGRILAQGMFASETLPVATASVPYSGGPLHDDAFQAVNYYRPAIIPDTEHVVVVSMPSLTELERAILGLVPEENSEVFVSMPWIFRPGAPAPVDPALTPNAVDRPANDPLEADEEEEEDERERENEKKEERTVDGEALEEIDRAEVEDVGAQERSRDSGYLNASSLTPLQQQDFSKLDETASAHALLRIRMQLRTRR